MEKYNIISGYVLSKENLKEITDLLPAATITWAGDTEEIKTILRLKGAFNYNLQCPQQLETETKQKLEKLLTVKIN
jgi:hypothetical protein